MSDGTVLKVAEYLHRLEGVPISFEEINPFIKDILIERVSEIVKIVQEAEDSDE